MSFDISNLKLEEQTIIEYETKLWNAFQSPDQWWAGIRISNQTETATFSIIFPTVKRPTPDQIKYLYHDTNDHPLDAGQNVTFKYDSHGRVSELAWAIAHRRRTAAIVSIGTGTMRGDQVKITARRNQLASSAKQDEI